MKWHLRLVAANKGIWKSTEMRRLLAEAGLEISAGKMSALWTTTPTTVRLDDLDVICAVLQCTPADLLLPEPEKVAAPPASAALPSGYRLRRVDHTSARSPPHHAAGMTGRPNHAGCAGSGRQRCARFLLFQCWPGGSVPGTQ